MNQDDLHIVCKNARINTEIRQTVLLTELTLLSMDWDIICFSETRLLSQDAIVHGDHRMISQLFSIQISGVIILIHKQHYRNIIRAD